MLFRYCLSTLVLCFCVFGITAQSIKKLMSEADAYYKHEKYAAALPIYLDIQYKKPRDMASKLKVGICSFFVNDLPNAKKYLQFVIENNKKTNPLAYYYLARTFHAELDFKEAVKYYKQFLKNTKDNEPYRRSVKDDIRRCATGMRIGVQRQQAIVENLGEKVNSPLDDFGPVLSPNYDNRIYFTSSRPGNRGGLRNAKGYKDDKYGNYNMDMFSTTVVNGEWTATTAFNSLINSPRHDMVLGFDKKGTMLYYSKGPNLFSGEVLVDTFQAADERKLRPDNFISPMLTENGDGTPHFYNDSLLIFSSARDGGYGGRDLYISRQTNGQWTKPENLGPVINSPYDETTPFLSVDGRNLYFSSNSIKSIGGFDIFHTQFDDTAERWSSPKNVGIPINSSADDAYFKLSKNGLKAFYSSSRKDGIGQRDIYVAYFKAPRKEQAAESTPATFAEVREYKYRQSNGGIVIETPNSGQGTVSTVPGVPDFSEEEIITYEFKPLFYTPQDEVLVPRSITELNKIARLLKKYPQLKVVLTSNSDGTSPPVFDLFFSAKRAEKAANYLVENGVNASNIIIKGCGANYPIALGELESGPNEMGQRLNRRIDVSIQNTAGLPLRIVTNPPRVSQYMINEVGNYYQRASKGLSYKVQIASIKQRYKGDIITRYPDAMVETNTAEGIYRYTVGLYQTVSSAEQLRLELERQGVLDAFVVPYVNGLRVSPSDSKIYAAAYPDLLNFLRLTGKE